MFKIISRILAFLVILTVIVIAIGSVLVLTLDPNEHKTDIANTISDAIGYPVHIRGEIDLKLFPILHLSVEDVLVESPPDFNASLLEIDKTTASVNPFPLLKGKLDIGEITLKQPRLNLLTGRDGKTNWENLLSPEKDDKPAAMALLVNRLSVENANIVWEDLKNNDSLRVEKLSLEMDSFISGEPVNIELTAVINDDNSGGGIQFSAQAEIHLDIERKIIDARNINIEASVWKDNKMQPLTINISGNGNYNSEQDIITLQDISLAGDGIQVKADIKILSVSKNPIVNFNVQDSTLNMQELSNFIETSVWKDNKMQPPTIKISGNGNYNSEQDIITLQDISLAGNGLQAKADIKILSVSKNPIVNFNVQDSTLNMQELSNFIEASVWKDNKMQPPTINISGNGNYNSEQDIITLQDVSLEGDGIQVTANIKILSVSENAIVNFNVQDSILDLRKLPNFMQIEDPHLPDKVGITTAGTLNPARKQIKLDTLNMNAEDISISGNGQLSMLTETPKIKTNLTVKMGTLDLSEQAENTAPKTNTGKTGADKTGKNAASTNLVIAPLAALLNGYQLSMVTNLTIGQLKLENLILNNLNTSIQIKGRKITMLVSETALFNGSFSGLFIGQIPTAGNPSWRMDGKIKQFDVEEILAVLSEEKPTFRGQATIDYQLTASGISEAKIKRSLDGNVHIVISNGRLFNPKLEKVLTEAITFLNKDAAETKTELLHIDELRTNAVFAGGVVKNNDLQMQTPLLSIAGAGKTNLITSALDYRLTLELKRHNKKRTIKIPLLVSGTIEKPKYKLDLPKLIKQEAEARVQKELNKQLDKVGETLNEELGKVLKKLKLPF